MARPLVIGSERSEVALPTATALLAAGASALDAVEAALMVCEDNLGDHYVGTGGLPNALGVVELDASVMIGSTRAFGAVGALKGFPHPISVARAVLDQLPQHCLLVGEGAERFAEESGFSRTELLTEESRAMFLESLSVSPDSMEGERTAASEGDQRYRDAAMSLVRRFGRHDGPWGTVNVIALDETGELCVGVSTSGYPFKYPGRIGDSAICGAGNYCDLRHGGAACTGRGEMAMRVVGARAIVDGIARGLEPAESCRAMLREAAALDDPFAAELRALALCPDGRHGGASGQAGSTYAVMQPDDDGPQIFPRLVAN